MAWTNDTTGGKVIVQGLLPVTITLTDTCVIGDLIGYDAISSNAWERADANAKVYAQFIAGENCRKSGDTIICYKMAVVSGFSGGTATVGGAAGHLLWLSDTPGAVAAEPVTNYHQCVGQMVSTTTAVFNVDAMPKMGFACETYSTGLAEAGFFRCELFNGVGASMMGGLKVETKVDATADTIRSARSIYAYHQTNAATTATEDNVIMRLETGGSTVAFAAIEFAGDPTNLFHFYEAAGNTAWRALGTTSTQSGWLKVMFDISTVRYIALYTTVA